MAEFQFERRSTERESENLVTKTNPEDWFFAHQSVDGFVRVIERRRVARAIGKKNSVGIECQHFFSRCGGWDDGHLEPLLPKQAQNIFLYTIVVCGNSEADRWQVSSFLAVRRFLDRPWRAELVLGVPTVNFLR